MLARAFATYFQVVNIAERVHRIRRRRDYQREGAAPQPESLRDVLERLEADGVGAAELIGWLDRLWVEPVFTAHPTEAVRRSLLEKEQAIVRALVDGFDPTRTPGERRADDAAIFMALSAGWQTAEASPVRPTMLPSRPTSSRKAPSGGRNPSARSAVNRCATCNLPRRFSMTGSARPVRRADPCTRARSNATRPR
jgi:hypothetical protein